MSARGNSSMENPIVKQGSCLDEDFDLATSMKTPRGPTLPSAPATRLFDLINEGGYNFVLAFSGQGSIVHKDMRTACQKYHVNIRFLRAMCNQVLTTMRELSAEHPSIKQNLETFSIRSAVDSCKRIRFAEFWSTDEQDRETSFFGWASREDTLEFPFSLHDVQQAEVSVALIAIASVINVFYFCETLDTHPFELCTLAKDAGVTMIGHSQGIISSVMSQGLIESPNKPLSEWEIDTDRLPLVHQSIALSTVIGAFASVQSRRLSSALRFAIPPLPKGGLETGDPKSDSCLLSVEGLDEDTLTKLVNQKNMELRLLIKTAIDSDERISQILSDSEVDPSSQMISIGLKNGQSSFVLTGSNLCLQYIHASIASFFPDEGNLNQARISLTKRRPKVSTDWLSVFVPFHSPLLTAMEQPINEACVKMGLQHCCEPVKNFSVIIDPSDGSDFMALPDGETVMKSMVSGICSHIVDYPLTHKRVKNNAIILCFGPGTEGHSAILNSVNCFRKGSLCLLSGVNGFKEAPYQNSSYSDIYRVRQFMETPNEVIRRRTCLSLPYSFCPPRVVSDGGDSVFLSTRYSTMSGNHPVLVAGMTPCTSYENTQLVINATNAGYHCELAGGGLPTEEMFREAIEKITQGIESGRGIHFNVLYLNKFLYDLHWSLLLVLKAEGYPLHSITFGAGAPAPDSAVDHIRQLKEAGFRYICFKPGNAAAMADVVEVASKEKDFPIVVQWTGGQGGGHHSFEDQTAILEKYLPRLRQFHNVYIFIGGGVGCGEDAFRYFSGEWSGKETLEEKLGYAVDGVLIGSRACIASEGRLVESIKQMLIKTEGIQEPYDSVEWEKCDGPEGHKGVISVKSELGEAIHVMVNRCTLFWKQVDLRVFDLPYESRQDAIYANRDFIVSGLMNDFQKPWFPLNARGEPIEFKDMTYGAILRRFVQLTATDKSRWFSITFRIRFAKMAERVEQLYLPVGRKAAFSMPSGGMSSMMLDAHKALDSFMTLYPQCDADLVQILDAEFFLKVFKMPGKPVNFVPNLEEFSFWFKRDSLWFSEDEESLPHGDPETVFVLIGPAAVARCTSVEPISKILDGINRGAAERMSAVEDFICSAERVAQPLVAVSRLSMLLPSARSDRESYHHGRWVETLSEWADLCGGVNALLVNSPCVVLPNSSMTVRNPLISMLTPRDTGLSLSYEASKGSSMLFIKGDLNCHATIQTSMDGAGGVGADCQILLTYSMCTKPLAMTIYINKDMPLSPLSFDKDYESSLNAFYRSLWHVVPLSDEYPDLRKKTYSGKFTFTREAVDAYHAAVDPRKLRGNDVTAEASVFLAWPLIAELITDIGGDVTRLVHLNHSLEWQLPIAKRRGFQLGEEYLVEGSVTKCWTSSSGVEVEGGFRIKDRDQLVVMELSSAFLVRQNAVESPALSRLENFWRRTNSSFTLISSSGINLLEFLSKSTTSDLEVELQGELTPGERLGVSTSIDESGSPNRKTCVVVLLTNSALRLVATLKQELPATNHRTGTLIFETTKLGKCVSLLSKNATHRNPVDMVSEGKVVRLDEPVRAFSTAPTFVTPTTMDAYAKGSNDTNVIHCSRTMASLAGLPRGPIVHGMWLYARAKEAFESSLSSNGCCSTLKVEKFAARFTAMVSLDDLITLQATLVAHRDGRKIYDVEVVDSVGSLVMAAEATVLPEQQNYMVTGQGSAKVGMGKDVRQSGCPEAKAFWELAELRFQDRYGISLVHIVDKNPSSYVVDLRGERGRQIRSNLLALKDGNGNPLLPALRSDSRSYRFFYPEGLLMATYFTQPAILVNATAQYLNLRSTGVVNHEDSVICGHSLGEFGALAMLGFISSSAIVDLAFYRGLCMDIIVPRVEGRSEFGMLAFIPVRISKLFPEDRMEELVTNVAKMTESFLEVANYNIPRVQYVLTGHKFALHAFASVCDELVDHKKEIEVEDMKAAEKAITKCVIRGVERSCYMMEDLETRGLTPHSIELTRGKATTPLVGIDVPFHSSHLKSSVASFQDFLQTLFSDIRDNNNVPPLTEIQNRYIPNLVGLPYAITREFGVALQKACVQDNKELNGILANESLWTPEGVPRLDATEKVGMSFFSNLLGNQLAASVQWIKTTETILGKDRTTTTRRRETYGSESVSFECGATAILSNVVKNTMRMPDYTRIHPDEGRALASLNTVMWASEPSSIVAQLKGVDQGLSAREVVISRNETKDLGDSVTDETADSDEAVLAPNLAPPTPSVKMGGFPALTSAALSSGAAGVDELEDVPVTAVVMLRALIAHKTNASYEDILPTKTIKDISGGKSTMVNELAADLSAELAGLPLPNDATEMTLEKLASSFAKYKKLGTVTTRMIQDLPFPAGYTIPNAKAYLKKQVGLGPMRADAALLLAAVDPPSSRFTDKPSVEKWLSTVATEYSRKLNITLPSPTMGGGASPMMFPMMQMGSPANWGGDSAVKALEDVSVPAILMLRALIAHKTATTVNEIQPTKTIKDISGGKSTMVNELAADLSAELAGLPLPNDATEMTLEKLASSFAKYNKLGTVTTRMIQDLPFPAGYTIPNAKACLKKVGLGPMRADAALLLAAVDPPSSRFTDKPSVEKWLSSSVATEYSQVAKVTLPSAESGFGGGGVQMMPMMQSASGKDEALREQLDVLVKDVRKAFGDLLLREDGSNETANDRALSTSLTEMKSQVGELTDELDTVKLELGSSFVKGIQPKFEPKKVRTYQSAWSWILQDSLKLLTLIERLPEADLRSKLPEIFDMNELMVSVISRMTDTAKAYLKDGLVGIESRRRELSSVISELLELIELSVDGGSVGCLKLDPMRPDIALNPAGPLFTVAKDVPREEGWAHDLMTLRRYADKEVNKELTKTLRGCVDGVLTGGLDHKGKTVLVTGCGPHSIGIELVKVFLSSGATVVATTSRDMSLETSRIYRSVYESFAATGTKLHVVPCNCASASDVNALIDYIYHTLHLDLDFVAPFAALPEKGKDISNIDERCELAHRLMYTNVERMIGRVVSHKRQAQVARAGEALVDPAIFLLPCSPNHGIFGADGLYAASKRALEVIGNKCVAEGWIDCASVVNVSIGWTRGTSLMGQFDAVSCFLEHPAEGSALPEIRTFSQAEMAVYIFACTAPELVELISEHPIFADFSGGLDLSPEDIGAAFGEAMSSLKSWNGVLSDVLASFSVAAVRNYFDVLYRGRFRRDPAVSASKRKVVLVDAIPTLPDEDRVRAQRAKYNFPRPLPAYKDNAKHLQLGEMMDLKKVPVIVGAAELGPFLNARARWEREAYGVMSQDTMLELCLFLGYIAVAEDMTENDGAYWVDVETKQPVHDSDCRALFEKKLVDKTGIRILTVDAFKAECLSEGAGYDGLNYPYFQVAHFERDSPAFTVASLEEGAKLKARQPDKVLVHENEDGTASCQIMAGASVVLPAQAMTTFALAAVIPEDYDVRRAGIPKSLDSIDSASKFTVITAADALLEAGIIDSWELFSKLHVSEVGNSIGGGFGGMNSVRSIFVDRMVVNSKAKIGSDTFAEVFINTGPAWVNMLLIGSAGPIRPAVGACGTAALSLENAIDSITKGDARVMLAGATDEYCRTSAYEFGMMKATRNSVAELQEGRSAVESSRPTATSRGGFVESNGSGVCVVCDAQFALDNGLPIRAVIPHVVSATDKIGRSVPAPGCGILTTSAEVRTVPSLVEDFDSRYKMFLDSKSRIDEKYTADLAAIGSQETDDLVKDQYKSECYDMYLEDIASLKRRYGSHVGRNLLSVSKLRSALLTWNMNVDEITAASFHGTSTQANDVNESATVNAQMFHLGRTSTKPIHVVCQKSVTGHPKGPAAQWMLNGAMQMFNDSVIPGNHNLDDVDPELRANQFLMYQNQSSYVPPDSDGIGVRAVLLKSFGFGQVGAETLAIHPAFLFRTLPQDVLDSYVERLSSRERKTLQRRQAILAGRETLLELKEAPLVSGEAERSVMLDPTSRRLPNGEFSRAAPGFHAARALPARQAEGIATPIRTPPAMVSQSPAMAFNGKRTLAVGFDMTNIEERSEEWIDYNFTEQEQEYCYAHANPSRAFSGRWAAKEAVVKAIGNAALLSPCSDFLESGAVKSSQPQTQTQQHLPLKNIEIVTDRSGATEVRLHGDAKQRAALAGVSTMLVSFSYLPDEKCGDEKFAAAYVHAT
eukprot:GHVH01002295.1.p1 GENE.GHVH01002295.1~~GHVH01002295.1.p1  ORF type:complete len:4163 (+),score=693.88 GHVH01002295.1:342-12830(+)